MKLRKDPPFSSIRLIVRHIVGAVTIKMLIATFTRSFYYHDSSRALGTFNPDKEKQGRQRQAEGERDIATRVGGRAEDKERQGARGVGA